MFSISSSMASLEFPNSIPIPIPIPTKLNANADPYLSIGLQYKISPYVLLPHEMINQTSYVPFQWPNDNVFWRRTHGFGCEPYPLYNQPTLNLTRFWFQPDTGLTHFQPSVHWPDVAKPSMEFFDGSLQLGDQKVDVGVYESEEVKRVDVVTRLHKTGKSKSFGFGRYVPRKRPISQQRETNTPKKWVPKKNEVGYGRRNTIPFPTDAQEHQRTGTTTVMIKNIPNQFGRDDLLRELSQHCREQNDKAAQESVNGFRSEFDFVYLPMDFLKYWDHKKIANLGYAFVNFTTFDAASKFHDRFHNRKWCVPRNNKTCEITVAKLQGKEALIESFRSKIFFCHSDEYLPLFLEPACDGFINPIGQIVGKRIDDRPRHAVRKHL